MAAVYRKQHLPNYDVFDEARYFTPGDGQELLIDIAGITVGLSDLRGLLGALRARSPSRRPPAPR